MQSRQQILWGSVQRSLQRFVKVMATDRRKCSASINAEGWERMHVVYGKALEQLAHYERYLTDIR